jgi:hypothetical protein
MGDKGQHGPPSDGGWAKPELANYARSILFRIGMKNRSNAPLPLPGAAMVNDYQLESSRQSTMSDCRLSSP